MSYRVRMRPTALKEIKRLPRDLAKRVYLSIQELRENPLPFIEFGSESIEPFMLSMMTARKSKS